MGVEKHRKGRTSRMEERGVSWKPKKWEGGELFFLIMFIIHILVTLKEKQVCYKY